MKPLDTEANRAMVKLIPSCAENGLALAMNLDQIAILLTTSVIAVNETTAATKTGPFALATLLPASTD
jgi:hypothetical protein